MNLMGILFAFIGYGLFAAMYNGETSTEPVFPTFTPPGIEFFDVPENCSGFTDCIEFVGEILTNFVLGIVYVVLLLVELVRFIVALMVVVLSNAFGGVESAPPWVNVMIVGMFTAATAIIIYKAARKGDTSA